MTKATTVNEIKLRQLDEALCACCSVPTAHAAWNKELAIAFSGGLDSRFLAFAARMFGYSVTLLHVYGPHVSPHESAFARTWADRHNLPFKRLFLNPLDDARIAANDELRCYFCKKRLFDDLLRLSAPLPLCDGTHASDTSAYRPGRKALRELGIYSPLEMAGFQKDDIRRIGADIGLDIPWQKARPCLLTRFPYGICADVPLLNALAGAEENMAKLMESCSRDAGIPHGGEPDFRLRIQTVTPFGADVELHVREQRRSFTQSESFSKKCRHLMNSIPLLRLQAIRHMDNLSGYFDRSRRS